MENRFKTFKEQPNRFIKGGEHSTISLTEKNMFKGEEVIRQSDKSFFLKVAANGRALVSIIKESMVTSKEAEQAIQTLSRAMRSSGKTFVIEMRNQKLLK